MTADNPGGDFMASRRRDLRLDVTTAAGRAHMTAAHWLSYERGGSFLLDAPVSVFLKIARALDVTLDTLAHAACGLPPRQNPEDARD